jgi:hypothetical protein
VTASGFRLPPFVGLVLVSLVVSVALLAAFKLTSNQTALKRARRGISAGLLELRLFQDDPALVGRALRDLLLQQARYLRYASVPLLWAAIPLVLLLSHLDSWYARAPLSTGEAAVLLVRLHRDSSAARPGLALEAPAGVRVETPAVWSASRREAAWRVRGEQPGSHLLRIRAGDAELTSTLHVGEALANLAPGSGAGPVQSVDIGYPARRFDLPGASVSWLPAFFVLTLLFTLLLRPLFRVTL